MSVHAWLIRTLNPSPRTRRKMRTVERALVEYHRTQWLPPAELRAMQLARLRAVVTHAYERSAFYRRSFQAAGVAPGDLRSLEDLRRFPVIEKEDLRDRLREVMTRPPGQGLKRWTTGGTTGIPVELWVTRDTMIHRWAAHRRLYGWWGVHDGDRCLALTARGARSRRARLLRFLLTNVIEYKMSDVDRVTARRIRWWLVRGGVRAVQCYPSALEYLAHVMGEDGWRRPPRLRAIFSTGEILHPQQRALIERVFHARVADEYGANEVGHVAGECPQGRLHVAAERILVEYVPHAESGGHEILVTDLTELATPLIRYRVGDLAAPGDPCPCGRGLPVMQVRDGRTSELLLLPDGRFTRLAIIARRLDDLPARGVPVMQYQVVQHSRDSLTVLLAGPSSLAESTESVRRELREVLGPSIAIAVEAAEAIPPQPSGKRPRFISLVGNGR